jgi:hypothetical protein
MCKEAAMATLTHRIELELAARELLPLADICGRRVRCLEGRVWITLDGDPRDVFLGPGESFVVDRGGVTLVHAMEPARLRLDAGGDARQFASPGWWRALTAAARAPTSLAAV